MAASTKAVDLYKSGGMNGLFGGVNDCYQNLQQKKTVQASDVEFCVGLDLSGVLIDSSMARAGGFRRDDRFLEDTAIDRMNALLTTFGISKEVADTQNYVGVRYDRVQRYTSQAIVVASKAGAKQRNPQQCIDTEMAKWEKKREKDMDKWCADLAKKGQECRISTGQDELVREEALGKITVRCQGQ